MDVDFRPDQADLDDEGFFLAFHAGRIGTEAFGHREHIRLAFIYLLRYPDLAEAALRFRRAFRSFVEAQGVAHIYNETLTWAYLVLVNQRMHSAHFRDSLEFLEHNQELGTHRRGLINRYYNLDDVTQSPLAKAVFVLPNPMAPRGKGTSEEAPHAAQKAIDPHPVE